MTVGVVVLLLGVAGFIVAVVFGGTRPPTPARSVVGTPVVLFEVPAEKSGEEVHRGYN